MLFQLLFQNIVQAESWLPGTVFLRSSLHDFDISFSDHNISEIDFRFIQYSLFGECYDMLHNAFFRFVILIAIAIFFRGHVNGLSG